MNPLSKDRLRILSHDLNSEWTCVHGAMYMFSGPGLSPIDQLLYEDMFSRNTTSLQASLTQLAGHLSLDTLLATISGLLSELVLQKSYRIMAQLDPLFLELNQLLQTALG